MGREDERPLEFWQMTEIGSQMIELEEGCVHLVLECCQLGRDRNAALGQFATVILRPTRTAAIEDLEQIAAVAAAEFDDGIIGCGLIDIVDDEIVMLCDRVK